MNKENQKATKKLSGFYIALCCCVLAIGLAGYFTERHSEKAAEVVSREVSEATARPVFSNEIINVSEPVSETLPEAEVKDEEAEAAAELNTDENSEASNDENEAELNSYEVDNPDFEGGAITVSSEQPAFIMPVNGEILEPYSEVLSYNNSLADWRTHNGIDIAADKGCSVQSAAQGVVERVYENAMGKCVEISHAGGFVTRYMGLEDVENLTEGKEVNSGEVIGITGVCKGENVTQPHLHFEMSRNGEPLNPSEYLPQE